MSDRDTLVSKVAGDEKLGRWVIQGDGKSVWEGSKPARARTKPAGSDVVIPSPRLLDPELSASDVEETRLSCRCSPDYHDWVLGLGDHLGGLSISQTIDQGLRRVAELAGWSQPPRRRAGSAVVSPYRPALDLD